MSNIPISSLPAGITLDAADYAPFVQGGTTKRFTARQIMATTLPTISTPTPSTDYFVPLRQQSTGLAFSASISEFMTALHGVPAGGTTGQLLAKVSSTDYDTAWASAGTVFSVGLSMPSIFAVANSPVTSSGTLAVTLNTEAANTVFSGPTTGSAATPAFRALTGADLPDPAPTTKGGVKSLAAVSHQFLTQIGTDGSVSQAQPAFSDISGTLGVAQGGTGLTSGTSGGILGFTGSTTLAASVALTANALVLGGGAGATPTPMGSLGTTTTVLHGNAAGAPTFGAVSLTADVSGILPSANGGTGVNNGSSTITLGGSLTTVGAFASIFRMSAATDVTFPTSGTLATTGGASIPTVAQGDLLYGSAANVLSALTKSATATRYLSNTGATNNPAWAQVDVTNGITGIVPVANGGTGIASPTAHGLLIGNGSSAMTQLAPSATSGIPLVSQGAASDPAYSTAVVAGGGTGLTSGTSGGILGFTGSTTLASSVLLTASALVLGGGAGATPTPLGSLGTTTTVLHGNAAGAPTFGAVSLTADVSGTLGVANGGTGIAAITAHNLLIGNGTSAATLLAPSATVGVPLVSAGASLDPVYGTTVVAGGGTGVTSATAYAVLCGGTTSTGAHQSIASVGTSGQVLTSAGAGALPTMAGITTALDAVVGGSTQGTILYRGSGAWQTLAPSTSGRVLTTNGAGLDPSWSAVTGTGTVTSVATSDGLSGGTITTTGVLSVDASFFRDYLAGLTLSTAGSSATFGIAAGVAVDSTNARFMKLATAYTKTTSSWAVGTGNGSLDLSSPAIATSTWYFVYEIYRSDTAVTDICISTSASGPNLVPTANAVIPAAYTVNRRIGAMKTNGSSQWTKFIQDGDLFMWDIPVNDVNAANPGTAAVSRTLTVPNGVRVQALLSVGGYGISSDGGPNAVYISDLSLSDQAAVQSSAVTFQVTAPNTGTLAVMGQAAVMTSTAAQVRSRIQGASTANTGLIMNTNGWIDRRGRDS